MHFNHYGGEAAQLAVELVNADPDRMTPDDLEPLLAAHGRTVTRLTDAQAEVVRAWRQRLARCFGPQPVDDRCRAVNELLADTASQPYVSTHGGRAPHLHYTAPGADAAAHLCSALAAGLAYVICFASPDRLGRCARRDCGRAFVDTSRNGRRAYCSVRCANNDAVARHRRQRRGPESRSMSG
jgi:predicted RNA-binding Zn ribbon-like protein